LERRERFLIVAVVGAKSLSTAFDRVGICCFGGSGSPKKTDSNSRETLLDASARKQKHPDRQRRYQQRQRAKLRHLKF
jgi:hypothetical protein